MLNEVLSNYGLTIKIKKIKLQMNEHEIFLQQAQCACISHICSLFCNIVLHKQK